MIHGVRSTAGQWVGATRSLPTAPPSTEPRRAAVIVGGGIAGLRAADVLAGLGHAPLILEARDACGGLIRVRRVGGLDVDLGAEGFASRSREVADLCADLGLPVIDPTGEPWIWAQRDEDVHVFRIPHGVLGIPATLDDPLVVETLSTAGLARAGEDLTMGPHMGSDATNLAALVTARLGAEVLDRLVRPVAGGIHAADPAELAIDAVAPGLRAGLAEHGSLIAAVAALRAAAPVVSAVASVAGGLSRVSGALTDRIVAAGGEVRTGRTTVSIAPAASRPMGGTSPAEAPIVGGFGAVSGWSVTHQATADPDDLETVTTDRLIIAVDVASAQRLLSGVPGLDASLPVPRGADVALAVLVLDSPELDAAPRGSGVLVAMPAAGYERDSPSAPSSVPQVACKALTHVSAKWPRTDLPPHRHILRLSYGRAGVTTPEPTPALALADASALLGVHLDASDLIGFAVERFPNALPPHTPEHRERVGRLLNEVAAHHGLGVTGAWVAGTGLAATLPHAAAVATRLAEQTTGAREPASRQATLG